MTDRLPQPEHLTAEQIARLREENIAEVTKLLGDDPWQTD